MAILQDSHRRPVPRARLQPPRLRTDSGCSLQGRSCVSHRHLIWVIQPILKRTKVLEMVSKSFEWRVPMTEMQKTWNLKSEERENVAYIGAGVSLKGEISVPDTIVVLGTVEGEITAKTIVVGPSGVVVGSIRANDAEIIGSVSESIEVKQLLAVKTGGAVSGNISYGEIELEKGAVITGEFVSSEHRSRSVNKSETVNLKPQQSRAVVEQARPSKAVIELASNLDLKAGS